MFYYLNRLPPDYRRRYYTNIAILVGIVLVVANFWRLGPRYEPLAIVWLVGAAVLFICVRPVYMLARTEPRPGRGAFIFAGTWIAAYAYVAASIFLDLPAPLWFLLGGIVSMWIFTLKYRKLLFPKVGERLKIVFAARRAAKDEWKSFFNKDVR